MDEAIRVESLTKSYRGFMAVDGISFNVNRGEIFGILGPNGAGKTTTLEILEGIQKPDSGTVDIFNLSIHKNSRQIKSRIGVQLQSSAYYEYLNLLEVLSLLASFYPSSVRSDPKLLLDKVDLVSQSTQRVNTLSGGEKQRFTIAASLINTPEIIILDEPTTGLDPRARRNIWELIQEIHNTGITVIMTTHYMEEAEELCQRLAIMDKGKLVAVDTPAKLRGTLEYKYAVKIIVDSPLKQEQINSLHSLDALVEIKSQNTYVIKLKHDTKSLDKLLNDIVQDKISLVHLEIAPVTLEDVFLELTGNELQEN